MSESPEQVSWFPVAERSTLSSETQALFTQLDERFGFVPNVFIAFAWREDRFNLWRAHFEHLMQPSPGLSRAEREMISVAVSAYNRCLYCMTAHGFAVRALLKDPVKGDRVTIDYRRAGLEPRQVAMLDYAVKLTREPSSCDERDLTGLRTFGFADEDLWDIVEVAAMFNFTNRLVSAAGIMPNREYQAMAR